MQKTFSIALVAGEGAMPQLMLHSMQKAQQRVLLFAIPHVTAEHLTKQADGVVFLHVTQLGKAIRYCQKYRISQIAFAGRIMHKSIFKLSPLHMDITTMKLWFSLTDKRADTILGAIVQLFAKKGITTASTKEFLSQYLAPEGILSQKPPSQKILDDVAFGWPLAKQIGKLDIGQTIIVKERAVVAVEGMEGTDSCLERAASLAGPGCVMIKVSKPQQDSRFDVPVIGRNTIEKLIKIEAIALVVESNEVLILDSDAISYANQHGLVVMAL